MNIQIRNEMPQDYRAVEELTREAFWGSLDHVTCDGEHLVVHKLRNSPSFVPELDFVAEVDGKIVGHIIYSLAKVVKADHQEIQVLNFGPLSVHPSYQRMGIGSSLMRHSIAVASQLGYGAIIFYGHPDYYPRFGFKNASQYGIVSRDGSSRDALMAMELVDGALSGVAGRFIKDEVYDVDLKEVAEFEKGFPYKEPACLIPIDILANQLPSQVMLAFKKHEIHFISQLQKWSMAEMLRWDGMDEPSLKQLNDLLLKMGQPAKRLPSSYMIQLEKLGVRHPICTLVRSKAGVTLYCVTSEGKKLILKVFENQEDTREIENYLILSKLGIPTLPLLGYTKNAILLPDVQASLQYRLGTESDLSDPEIAKCIAQWYTLLHQMGTRYVECNTNPMYDESDLITLDNIKLVAEKTGTIDHPLWQIILENDSLIHKRMDALPRTLTYNDFYWTNLIVSKDGISALMYDYNLLGKGVAYSDICNVISSLSSQAKEAFLEEYRNSILEEQKQRCLYCATG